MITRGQLLEAGVRHIRERGTKAASDPLGTMEAIADEMGLRETGPRGSCLFVRQTRWVPVDVAARFDVVIVACRVERAGQIRWANTDPGWYAAVRARGVEVVLWDWMISPGLYQRGLESLGSRAAALGAVAVLLNVEPHPDEPRDWRGRHAELNMYARAARAICDRRGLELWVTSWADPPASFPLRELVGPADVSIPQPYEVHGRAGDKYVAAVLAEWRDAGAERIILGRGAHELDTSDLDTWRTADEILAHRRSTPSGMGEAWWVPRGHLSDHGDALGAMLA